MVFAYNFVVSDFAVELITGAIIGAILSRVMRGGVGTLADILFGLLGAVGLAFLIAYFGLFALSQYGLGGTILVAVIGAIVLVAVVHLFTSRRRPSRAAL